MQEFEPGAMWLHRGELNVAQEIARKLRNNYKDTKFGDMMDDTFLLIMDADRELARMTEEKNKTMYDELTSDFIDGEKNGHI